MAAKKKYDDISKVELTHVSSGDSTNSVFVSYLNSNEKLKKEKLDTYLKKGAMDLVLTQVFEADSINDEQFRRIVMALCFYDAVVQMNNTSYPFSAKDYYFALLVNWNAGSGKVNKKNKDAEVSGSTIQKIRSESQLSAARDLMKEKGLELDYREYVLDGEIAEDCKFKGKYKTVTIKPDKYSRNMVLALPVIQVLPGLPFRLCMEHVPGKLTVVDDTDSTEYVVPEYVWEDMVSEVMKGKKTARFTDLEFKLIGKKVKKDYATISGILRLGGVKTIMTFLNAYKLDFTEEGELLLPKSGDLPEIPDDASSKGFSWTPKGSIMRLSGPFYLVDSNDESGVKILMP